MIAATELEKRTAKLYRRVLIAGLIVIVGLAIWLLKPPPRCDLTFLAQLRPTRSTEFGAIKVSFDQGEADTERFFDANLLPRGWTKTGASPYARYMSKRLTDPVVMLEPRYPTVAAPISAPPAKPGAAPVAPSLKGTVALIYDNRGVAVMPPLPKTK
jgi:hypothetical protein